MFTHSAEQFRFIILGNKEILRLFTWVFIDLMIRGFEPVTRRFELVTHGFELVTHGFEIVTRGFELVTRVFELALLNLNSCFKAFSPYLVTRVLPYHIFKNSNV